MNRVYILTVVFFLSVVVISCGESSQKTKPAGSLNGPCYDNKTCDGALTCVYDVCIDLAVKNDNDTADQDTLESRDDSANTGDFENTIDSGDSSMDTESDDSNTGDSGDSADTSDTGNSGDSANTGNSGDSANTGNSGDTDDGCDTGFDAGDTDIPTECTPCEKRECYEGPSGSKNVGSCKAGQTTCMADGSDWSYCMKQVLPKAEICGDGIDQNCDGSDMTQENKTDIDGDGYTYCDGDCCETDFDCALPESVNSNRKEVPENGMDDNCNGKIDE